MAHAFMTLYVSTLSMSYEVSGATSLCFSDINENLPFRSLFEVLFDLWRTFDLCDDGSCFRPVH